MECYKVLNASCHADSIFKFSQVIPVYPQRFCLVDSICKVLSSFPEWIVKDINTRHLILDRCIRQLTGAVTYLANGHVYEHNLTNHVFSSS